MPKTKSAPSRKCTRVRVNAWVPQEIAPLVEALNDFPDMVTLETHGGSDREPAWVSFSHRELDPGQTLAFIQFLTSEIQSRIDEDVQCKIGLEWSMGGENQSMAKLEASLDSIRQIAEAVAEIAVSENGNHRRQ